MTFRKIILIALALAGVAPARGETAPLDVLKQSNAGLRRFVLDNGMIGLVKEDRSAPVAAVQIWVGTGAIHEGDQLGAGLSHFVEHMIFKGTPTRKVGDITREINDAGGEINAYTSHDRTVFYATLPAAKWTVGLDVLADAVMNASFPSAEWKKERDVILREFAMNRDEPEDEVGKLLFRTAFRVHPYQYPVIGYEDIFRAATRDDLVRYFRRNYVPDNMIVAVVGDVKADEVEARLRATFAGFRRRARAPMVLPQEPAQMAPRFARDTGPVEVSRLEWAYPTVPLNHPDAPALDVLSTIVGGGRSSRLAREIKENRKLVFDISAWSYTPQDPGLFGLSATFDPTNEAAVVQAIEEEIDRWAAGGFTEEEIAKARRQVLVGELSGLQTMNGQANSYASGEYYAADARFSERYLEHVEKVTAAQLKDVAARYLAPANRTIALLAPESAPAPAPAPEAAGPGADVKKLTLANGVPLIVREDHRLPFVHFCAALRGGLLTETEADNGITELTAELLTRGAAGRSADEIAAAVENLGGSLSAFAGRNSFGLQARCLSGDAETFAGLLADCLIRPDFPAGEIEKQRTVQLAAIQQQREQPFFLAEEALRQVLFPGHPYRWAPEGTRETVRALTRDQILAHFRRHAVRGNVVLSVFGDLAPERARELAERFFAALPDGGPPALAQAAAAPRLPVRLKKREPKQQAIVLVGCPGVTLADPRMDALAAIEDALTGLSSDLSMAAREKKGYVYYIGAFNRPGLEPGAFVAYAGTREDAAADIERLMADNLARIAKGGLREEELRRAREQIIAAQQMSLQDNGALAQACALNELYGLGYDYSFGTEARMKALTPEQVREAAESLFAPARRAVSVVLPGKPEDAKETTP